MRDCPKNPPGFVFGAEKSISHIAHRIDWENWCSLYYESIGHHDTSDAHADTARAYCRLLIKACK